MLGTFFTRCIVPIQGSLPYKYQHSSPPKLYKISDIPNQPESPATIKPCGNLKWQRYSLAAVIKNNVHCSEHETSLRLKYATKTKHTIQ
jgi:hypothetical protein